MVEEQKRSMIEMGKASHRASTRKLTARLEELKEQLTAALRQEEASRVKLEELAELDRRRDALRAELGLGSVKQTSQEGKLIREWAKKQGMSCPQYGKVPQDIRRAYELSRR